MSATKTTQAAARVAASCVALRARKLARIVTRVHDEALREHDMTAAQLGLLGAIELKGPVQPVELGQWLEIDKSTLSRNLRLMTARGWVTTVAVADDGRGRAVRLKAAGRKAFLRAMPAWEAAQDQCKKLFGPEVAGTLDILLHEGA